MSIEVIASFCEPLVIMVDVTGRVASTCHAATSAMQLQVQAVQGEERGSPPMGRRVNDSKAKAGSVLCCGGAALPVSSGWYLWHSLRVPR
jgi:hypothetical protein